jgi:hypothetical protein
MIRGLLRLGTFSQYLSGQTVAVTGCDSVTATKDVA